MKKFSKSFVALFLILSMCMSVASCSTIESFFDLDHDSRRHSHKHDDDDEDDEDEDDEDDKDKDDEEEDETEPSETEEEEEDPSDVTPPQSDNGVITGSNGLTYPDHIATYDEIHPQRNPGNVTGDEASDLLDEIEIQVLNNSISSYIDADILFENPEDLGIEVEGVSWGDIGTTTEEDIEFVNDILEQLYTINYESLDTQDRLFYDKIVYDLEESAYAMNFSAFDYYTSVLNPLTGPQCEVFFILHVVSFETVEDAENYILLLEDLDRYYDLICDFEEDKAGYGYALTDDQYEQIAESFDNLVAQEDDCFLYESFEDRLDAIDGLTDDQREELIDAHNTAMHDYVFPEFEECAERMRALEGSGGEIGGLTQYEGGKEYFAILYRRLANSSMNVEDSIDQLDQYLEDEMALMTSLASSSDFSWFDEYMNHSYTMGDTNDNLDYLSGAVAEDFPALPEHSYALIDVPEAFEDNFSPAAYLGYHLDNFDSNLIITNNANVDENFGTTCAHEGYPGHMFQSVYTRSVCEHPYMYLADSTGYSEGWATYVENYSYKYFGENEVAMGLIEIENELNVLIMARIDAGINYEGWTLQDCADFYSELVGQTIPASSMQDMFDLMAVDPGYAVKYGVGYVNTTLLMRDIRADFPNVSESDIHATYLEALPGTFEQIENYMRSELG